VTVPSSLTFISEHKTSSQCLSACYKQNGDLLVGTSDGLYVLRRGEYWLNPCSTDVKSVTSVVEHYPNVFILHATPGAWKVEMCLADDITKRKELFQFPKKSNTAAVMTVSDRYVVVKNPDTKELIIYDFTSQQTETTNLLHATGLQFLPDGCLLGIVEGTLEKYEIENGQLVELWTCVNIEDGYSLCTDSDGLIYTAARFSKKIFVVSFQGAVNNIGILIKVHCMLMIIADIKILFILGKMCNYKQVFNSH